MVVARKCASSLGEITLRLLVHPPGEAWGEVTWWSPHCPPRKAWGKVTCSFQVIHSKRLRGWSPSGHQMVSTRGPMKQVTSLVCPKSLWASHLVADIRGFA
jgi:hypothetical protein